MRGHRFFFALHSNGQRSKLYDISERKNESSADYDYAHCGQSKCSVWASNKKFNTGLRLKKPKQQHKTKIKREKTTKTEHFLFVWGAQKSKMHLFPQRRTNFNSIYRFWKLHTSHCWSSSLFARHVINFNYFFLSKNGNAFETPVAHFERKHMLEIEFGRKFHKKKRSRRV